MSTTSYLLSGFGGQGILFAGKFLAYKGLVEGKQLSWLPSYGPEMRGGTASCGVIVGDEPVGSPIVSAPDVLVAMNLPSLDRYEAAVLPGGMIVADATLIERKVNRTDVRAFYLPATRLAGEKGLDGLANMILIGKVLKECGGFCQETVEAALHKVISARHADKLQANFEALRLGASL